MKAVSASPPSFVESEVEVISKRRVAKIATAKFFGNRAPVQVQAQVLLVNAVDMAMRIPKRLLTQAFRCMSKAHATVDIAYAFIAKLVGLGPSRLSDLFSRVRDNGWKPCPEQCGENRCISDHSQSVKNAVRMALANIVEGSSGLQYERDIARLELTAPRGQDGRLPPVRMVALPADIQQRHLLLYQQTIWVLTIRNRRARHRQGHR